MTQIQLNDIKYMCINIYAPNEDKERINFFNGLSGIMYSKAVHENIVLGGDFNVTLETIDKKSKVNNIHKSAINVKDMMRKHFLVDIWRRKNPNTKKFTWSNEHKNVMCRLDYFLISKNLVSNCKNCKITESILTDHKLITLDTQGILRQSRGPGFHKFNDSLLEDKDNTNLISHTLIDTINELNYIEDKRVVWDMLKFEIQCKSIQFSKQKARTQRNLETNLLKECDELYLKMCNSQLSQNEHETYRQCKSLLEDINHYKEKGARIRSRVEFIDKNEKSNYYFYNKEKESYEKKTIEKLNINDTIVDNKTEILNEKFENIK